MCFTSPNDLRVKFGGRVFSKNGAPLERQGTLQIRGGGGATEGGGSFPRAVRCFCKNLLVFTVFGATGFGVPGKRVNPFGRQV